MCIVGSSGVGKTPAIKWCLKPIQDINAKHRKAYEQAKTEAEKNEIEFTENRKSLFITDATIEALISNLEHSKGILYFRDEIIGWLKDMNKYRSSGSDDLLFMQMWNSNDTISMERKTQSIFIENPYLNVLGSTQPKRLGEFTKNGASESGFFQRILFTYPDAKIEDRTNKKENKELKKFYSNLITKTYDDCRSFENEITLQLSKNGNNMITNFVNNFIKKQQRLFRRNDLLIEILSKLETYILRFTLIFEVMDTDEINWTKDVSDKSIIKAISTVIYFYYYSQKIIHTNEQNLIYQNDSDKFIHSMLSENITKGIIFTTGEALTILENRYSKPTLIKHLKNTGKFLYENMGRGKYEML
jgi:predicted DCC family thiol-disulfide oxidoreductase YuxK